MMIRIVATGLFAGVWLRAVANDPMGGVATAATSVRVASNLNQPVYVTSAPKDSRRLFILEKPGLIRVLNLETGRVNPTPFLEIADVQSFGEGSLLGMAFAPDFADSGRFFVSYPRSTGGRFVVSYQVSAGSEVADPSSAKDVFRFGDHTGVHLGGWIGFRPGTSDLFVTSGDGDGLTPETGHKFLAQNPSSLQGKIYRIRPAKDGSYEVPSDNPWFDGALGFRPETWAYGVRNPWRASFDRVTGDFWFGDVGGSQREEVDFEPATSAGGRNYGWSYLEGMLPTGWIGSANVPVVPPTAPVLDYPHLGSDLPIRGSSVIGGYVYRGQLVPSLVGRYVFGDYINGRLFSLIRSESRDVDLLEHTAAWSNEAGSIQYPSSLGEDSSGELYVVSYGDPFNPKTKGSVHRIVPSGPPQLRLGDVSSSKAALQIFSVRGRYYQIETSTNLATWEADSESITGSDQWVTREVSVRSSDTGESRFWRVRSAPWAP